MNQTPVLNCLVVEDEPLAAAILEDYIRQTPWLHFSGRCSDALHAAEALRQQHVDLLFLDIHLPGLKGLDFLRTLPHPPQTIVTTAFQEYALEGYELGVIDYLLKPVDFERFLKAVQKIRRAAPAPERAFHFFNCNKKMVRVWLDDIQVVESVKEYVKLYLADGTELLTKSPLGKMETILADLPFVRPHRSFLVALAHIRAFTATELQAGRLCIPVGRQYKSVVQQTLAQWTGNPLPF